MEMNGTRVRLVRIIIALRQWLRTSLRMSITVRLALGFLLAALLAATVTGVIGFQRMSVLHAQAMFYQALLQTTTNLTTGGEVLKAINIETSTMLADATTSHMDEEAVSQDEQTLTSLLHQYHAILLAYTTHDLLAQHTNQVAVLENEDVQVIANQQRTYAAGAWHTWSIYEETEQRIVQNIETQHVSNGQALARLQGEPEFDDALSALGSLIQFDENLASLVDGAPAGLHAQSFATLPGTILVFLAIVLIGFLLSRSLILRLTSLHRVTQAIQQGQMHARVVLKGQDEITDVSRSVNTMLDALVAALHEATTAREQTELAYARQRQLNEMKNQFIRHVSHELRTPLTEVYGFLQLLQDHQEELDPALQQMFVTQAMKGCEELINLCTGILDTSNQATPMRPPQRTSIALAKLLEELLAQQSPQERAAHPVYLEIPANLTVQADPQYVRQIFRNLLSNAFKYTSAQQAVFLETFPLDREEGRDQAGIRVRDTGPGIPPEEQGLLFQPFMRLKRDFAGSIRGTGLGLSLCRQFVEAMGGRIWVESSGIPGEGSSFCMTLPTMFSEIGDSGLASDARELPGVAI